MTSFAAGKNEPALWDAAVAREITAPVLRTIEQLALAEGDVDLAWVAVLLAGRDDLAVGARIEDSELGRLAAGESIRHGLRELHRRGLLEIRVEREGRPTMSWSAFVPEA